MKWGRVAPAQKFVWLGGLEVGSAQEVGGQTNKLIPPSDSIRDLGITNNSKLNLLEYIDEIVSRAFQRTYLLFRSFVSGNISILTRAFITYVRPLVEYCSFIWSQHQIHYIDKIERIQRYFTRRALKCVGLSYVYRLLILNLES